MKYFRIQGNKLCFIFTNSRLFFLEIDYYMDILAKKFNELFIFFNEILLKRVLSESVKLPSILLPVTINFQIPLTDSHVRV
jgi:hypothetical protein